MNFKRGIKGEPLLEPHVPTTDDNILRAMRELRYPVYVTTKLDGIRAHQLRVNDKPKLMSYAIKPIRNKEIAEAANELLFVGADMELYNPTLNFQQVTSRVSSIVHEDSSSIQFHLLDWILPDVGYMQRIDRVNRWLDNRTGWTHRVKIQQPIYAQTPEILFHLFLESEIKMQEGICFRLGDGRYKSGRSSVDEQLLVKLCRWVREEVKVIGFEEQYENGNTLVTRVNGLSERSSSGAQLYGKNTLGAFYVEDKKGRNYKVGTGVGLGDKLRKLIWDNRERYLYKEITIKYKPHGEKDVPRQPIFCGFREKGY